MEGQKAGEKNGNEKRERRETKYKRVRERGCFLAAQASYPRTVNLLFEILFIIEYWQAQSMQSLRKRRKEENSKDLPLCSGYFQTQLNFSYRHCEILFILEAYLCVYCE